jgi:hypothetical protein
MQFFPSALGSPRCSVAYVVGAVSGKDAFQRSLEPAHLNQGFKAVASRMPSGTSAWDAHTGTAKASVHRHKVYRFKGCKAQANTQTHPAEARGI